MKKLFSVLTLALAALPLFAGGYDYTLGWDQPASHLYKVSLKAEPAAGSVTDFQIPAWRPGRYIIQRYSAAVSAFEAFDEKGKKLSWQKTDRDTWQVQNPRNGKIEIRYHYYANETDAGSSYLSPAQAYFNPSNLFMHVRDRYAEPCTLRVPALPDNWKAATSLNKTDNKTFTAPDYHEFVDAPTILSPTLTQFSFQALGATFWFHFQGNFAGGKATQDTLSAAMKKIVEAQTAIFGELPLKEYHFIVQLLPYNMRHAVEHSYSSCYAMPETVAKDAKSIAGMYGILSHEFFHLWNVKRVRPAALWPYDYQREQYTRLHWFTEGVTDYYTELAMVRAGLMTRETYLKNWGSSLASLDNSYATTMTSPEHASFESWQSGSDYADPHQGMSYYPLGERVGLLLDLHLRKVSDNEVTLDQVMKYLYDNYYKQNKGVPEDGIETACEKLTGKKMDDFFASFVAGTEKPDYKALFKPLDIAFGSEDNPNSTWPRIGIDRVEKVSSGIVLTSVNPAGEAATAGLSDGDLVLAINDKDATKLADKDFFTELDKNDELSFRIFRDGAQTTVTFVYKASRVPQMYTLTLDDKLKDKTIALLDSWLGKARP